MDLSRIAELRDAPVPPACHLIDGLPRPASDAEVMQVTSPLNGAVLTTFCLLYTSDAADE